MKYKGERLSDYRIDFVTADETDWGFEMIEAHTADEAIEIFRQYYSKEKYRISDVLKRVGRKAGAEAWAER